MSIGKKMASTLLSAQGNLFDKPIAEGGMDVRHAFRAALSRAISGCKDSRYQIAGRVSEWGGRHVSKDMLDKYSSGNFDYGLHAEDLPSIVAATKSFGPVQVLLDPFGAAVVSPEETDYVRLARLLQEDQKRQIEIAQLKGKLGIK
jgi:hypothetical protein